MAYGLGRGARGQAAQPLEVPIFAISATYEVAILAGYHGAALHDGARRYRRRRGGRARRRRAAVDEAEMAAISAFAIGFITRARRR